MRTKIAMAAFALVAGICTIPIASAQTPSCDEIEFTGPAARKFPNANDACIEVVVRDGMQYAHFQAEFIRKKGDTVQLRFKHSDGKYGETVALTPPEGQRVKIGGQQYSFNQMETGQEFDVWLPSDRWEVAVEDDLPAATTVTWILLEEPDDYMAAALPSTASPVPSIGLAGLILLVLGAAVWVLRRRSET